MLGGMLGGDIGAGGAADQGGVRCSRAGCADRAAWAILWRNPKIHTAERRKTWLACPEHRTVLEEFLGARDFPLTVIAADSLSEHSDATAPKERDA